MLLEECTMVQFRVIQVVNPRFLTKLEAPLEVVQN